MIGMCTSLLARGLAILLAKRYFSFAIFIAIARFRFKVRFRFEIRSVCSLAFLSERSVLCFLFSEDDDFRRSDLSELLFLS